MWIQVAQAPLVVVIWSFPLIKEPMDPLVVSVASLIIALVALSVTIWRTRKTYNDSDVEELADEVGRLARRARADTMRRVRAEKGAASPDGAPLVDGPPELRAPNALQPAASDPRAAKELIRKQLLGGGLH